MIYALKKQKGKINLGSIYGNKVLGTQENCNSISCWSNHSWDKEFNLEKYHLGEIWRRVTRTERTWKQSWEEAQRHLGGLTWGWEPKREIGQWSENRQIDTSKRTCEFVFYLSTGLGFLCRNQRQVHYGLTCLKLCSSKLTHLKMQYAILESSHFPTFQVEDKWAPIRDTVEQRCPRNCVWWWKVRGLPCPDRLP